MTLISVVVTTYNWPDAIKLSLASLFDQIDTNFEIIVADDGSNTINQELTQAICEKSPVPIQYVHHEDRGFRAGTIRNKAVAKSNGSYLLFIDGDCLLKPDFIANHRKLSERGYFVPGNRVLLSPSFTREIIEQGVPLHLKPMHYFVLLWMQRKINRITALLTFPLGFLRYIQPKKWQKAMTCNLAMWKDDFMHVNGFDELFEGWGYEDSDLVIRLIHSGVSRKEGRFAVPVLHLWHSHYDKSNQDVNYKRLMERLVQKDLIYAYKGVSQYLI